MSTIRCNNISNLDGSKSNTTNTIVQLGFPDWGGATLLALNVPVTITQRGWILMRNTIYTSVIEGYINGNEVLRQAGESNRFQDWNSLFVPVDVGDVVRLDIVGSGGELKFFPCKN